MSKAQRDKGASFEREVCTILSDRLGITIRRNLAQSRGGAQEGADITVGPFSFECKRRASIAVYAWLEQARRDAGGKIPVVVARGDGKRPIVIMDLEDAMPLLQGEFE